MTSIDISCYQGQKAKSLGQAIMLFLYGMIVSFAVVLVVFNNFSTVEENKKEEAIIEAGRKESKEMATLTSVPGVYDVQDSEENSLGQEWEIEVEDVENEPEIKSEVLEVRFRQRGCGMEAPGAHAGAARRYIPHLWSRH